MKKEVPRHRRHAKLGYLKTSRTPLGPRMSTLELSDQEYRSADGQERFENYSSKRWTALRKQMLRTRECRKCFFCGAWSNTLEHLVGHGEDAMAVAAALGYPSIDPDWRARFWEGPFVGSCDWCAKSRSGAEKAGKLLAWTQRWLEKQSSRSRGVANITELP